MKKLYKQLVKDISNDLNRAPVYVAHCILGRYTAKRSELQSFIQAFQRCGLKVSERDFLYGTKLSNHRIFTLFRRMHTKSEHDKASKRVRPRLP